MYFARSFTIKVWSRVTGQVKAPVAVGVTNENIPSVRYVDPIGEVGDALTPDHAEVKNQLNHKNTLSPFPKTH